MSKKTDDSRRNFITRGLAAIPLAVLGTAIPPRLYAAAQVPSIDIKEYKPQYFTEKEWEFLLAACDQLIPSEGEGPGAVEANVPIFIDKQMLTPYGEGRLWYMSGPFHPDMPPELGYQLRFSPKEIYRTGIADTDNYCLKQYGKRFAELDDEQQIELLKLLESGRAELENIPGHTFFEYLLKNTKEGYFADPMYGGNKDMGGWKLIGFPGARADYMDWQSQHNKKYPFPPVSIEGKRG